MMVRRLSLCLGVAWCCLFALPVGAKPKNCLTSSELLAEQIVRHGVFLREASRRCDDMAPGSRAQWQDFDTRFGPRLARQTAARLRVFKREFPDDWQHAMAVLDGRLVTHHRNVPIDQPFCDNIQTLLQEDQRGGWNIFAKQAKSVQDEAILDYRPCDSQR